MSECKHPIDAIGRQWGSDLDGVGQVLIAETCVLCGVVWDHQTKRVYESAQEYDSDPRQQHTTDHRPKYINDPRRRGPR